MGHDVEDKVVEILIAAVIMHEREKMGDAVLKEFLHLRFSKVGSGSRRVNSVRWLGKEKLVKDPVDEVLSCLFMVSCFPVKNEGDFLTVP